MTCIYLAKAPFVVYAHFEALVIPTGQEHPERGHRSFDYECQTPCSVGYYIVSTFPQFNNGYQARMGEDCLKWLITELMGFEKKAMQFYNDEKRLQWDPRLEYDFNQEIQCHICHKLFNTNHTDKVRDHDHVTGQNRGAAHKWCNIRLRRNCKIPVIFHNFRGYDSHFITMPLKDFEGVEIRVIGQGMEKYLTLSVGKYLVFKDSLQFLGSRLATLDKNLLKTGLESFKHLSRKFLGSEAQEFRLLVRKGVYKYEYRDSWDKMEDQQLPPKEAFHSKMTDSDISSED